MIKKMLSLLLALSMSATVLAACNNEPVDDTENPDGQQQEEVQGDEQYSEEVSDMLTLVSDGVSEYVIVRGENASPSEVTASTELQSYLKQISGAELQIVTDATAAVEKEIVVGKTNRETDGEFDREELGDDGFVIKTNGSKLYLVGGEQRGTLYSVYTFLEEYLGVRYYTATVEKIPELKTISLDQIAEDKQIPVFEYRDIDWIPSRQGTFQAKLKANGIYAPLGDDYGSHYSYVGFVHTMDSLVPPSVYLAEHPEYYNEDYAKEGKGQPCLSNPEVLAIATANACQWLIDNPNAKIISISQNDNQDYCECDECNRIYEEEGSQAGVLLRFVNAIATELKDEFPNVKFDTLAYQYTRTVPKITRPADNVIVRLCTIECCFSHPLGECEDFAKKVEQSNISDDIKAWSEVCDTLYVWDYVTNYSHSNAFFPDFNTMLPNAKFFADHNVIGLYEEANYFSDSADFTELRAYILGKIMWDPYMSEEEYWGHIDDFLEGVYGPGWTEIRAYIDLAQELTKDTCFNIGIDPGVLYPYGEVVEVNPKGSYPEDLTADMIRNYETVDWSKYWHWYKDIPEEGTYLKEAAKLFEAAMAKAETEEQKKMIDKASLQVDYVMSNYMYEKLLSGNGSIGKIILAFNQANPDAFEESELLTLRRAIIALANEQAYVDYAEFNKNLSERLSSYGITAVHEGSNGVILPHEQMDYTQAPADWYDD